MRRAYCKHLVQARCTFKTYCTWAVGLSITVKSSLCNVRVYQWVLPSLLWLFNCHHWVGLVAKRLHWSNCFTQFLYSIILVHFYTIQGVFRSLGPHTGADCHVPCATVSSQSHWHVQTEEHVRCCCGISGIYNVYQPFDFIVLLLTDKWHSSPPIDNNWAVMIVWTMRGKIIRTVLCCIVYPSLCPIICTLMSCCIHVCFQLFLNCGLNLCLFSLAGSEFSLSIPVLALTAQSIAWKDLSWQWLLCIECRVTVKLTRWQLFSDQRNTCFYHHFRSI